MTLDLDRLAELDAAATPGPWALDGPWWWENEHCTTVVTDAQRRAVCIEPPPPSDPTLAHANVALIVAMRNALPALIAAARTAPAIAARARRAAIEECIEACNRLDKCEWGCEDKASDLLIALRDGEESA